MNEPGIHNLLKHLVARDPSRMHEAYIDHGFNAGEKMATMISEKYAIRSVWNNEGVIQIDKSASRNADVQSVIRETRDMVDRAIKSSLSLESMAIELSDGNPVQFGSIDEYIDYALTHGGVKQNFRQDESGRIAITDGLLCHWRQVADQVILDKYMEGIDWGRFVGDKSVRKTHWRALSFLEMGQQGRWQQISKSGITEQASRESQLSTSSWVTHTTGSDYARRISESGYIDSTQINFAASKVVRQQNKDIYDHVTFIYDINDLHAAGIPLVYGDYSALEGEIKSNIPVPVRLARAVVPQKIFDAHQTRSYSSGGWMSQDIDPAKIL